MWNRFGEAGLLVFNPAWTMASGRYLTSLVLNRLCRLFLISPSRAIIDWENTTSIKYDGSLEKDAFRVAVRTRNHAAVFEVEFRRHGTGSFIHFGEEFQASEKIRAKGGGRPKMPHEAECTREEIAFADNLAIVSFPDPENSAENSLVLRPIMM
jgi:hypothetical protein